MNKEYNEQFGQLAEILEYIIHCKSKKCPICDLDIDEFNGKNHVTCKRNCYSIRLTKYDTISIKLFGHTIATYSYDKNCNFKMSCWKTIIEHLHHWKENERYIAQKLLGEPFYID